VFRLDDSMVNDFVYGVAMAAHVFPLIAERIRRIFFGRKLYSFTLVIIVL